MRCFVGLGECNCCDYFFSQEGAIVLIEEHNFRAVCSTLGTNTLTLTIRIKMIFLLKKSGRDSSEGLRRNVGSMPIDNEIAPGKKTY